MIMKNSIYILTFLFATIISFAQTKSVDPYSNGFQMNSLSGKSLSTNINISQINYRQDVELKVVSKKITENEIEVLYEFVDKQKGCYRGCNFNRDNKNYSGYIPYNFKEVKPCTNIYKTYPSR